MKKYLYLALLAVGIVVLMMPPTYAGEEDGKITFHGEVRVRGEYQNNASDLMDSGDDPSPGPGDIGYGDDGGAFFPYRIRLALEASFTKNVSAWIEVQNAGVFGGDDGGPVKNGTIAREFGFADDDEGLELYQGNITLDKLWSDNFSLRLGRQELVFGNELVLGDLDFYSGIAHDGALGTWNLKNVDVSVFYTRPWEGSVEGNENHLPPDQISIYSNPDTTHLWGGYATWHFKSDQDLDVYVIEMRDRYVDSGDDSHSPATLDTIGVRYAHCQMEENGPFWNIEVAQQFGEVSEIADDSDPWPTAFYAGQDFEGMAIEGWFGWNFVADGNKHKVYGRVEQATGDDDSTPDIEGFVPLFGDFHNRTGHGDWFQLNGVDTPTYVNYGGPNAGHGLQALSIGYNGFYNDRHEFGVALWTYKFEEDNCKAYPSACEDDLGDAIDIWYGFKYSKNLSFTASLSQLDPGDGLIDSYVDAPDDSVMRLYGQARLRF